MRQLSNEEMRAVEGGDWLDVTCGLTIGATIVATSTFGVIGFALTINKALAACALAAAL